MVNTNPLGQRARNLVEYLTITVQTEKRLISVDRSAKELARFNIGDQIRHIRGAKYLQAHRQNSTVRDCVMCGCLVRESGTCCPHCGFSLVQF